MGSIPRVKSRTPWRMRRTSGLLVWTTMPSETGVWQEAGNPRRPSTCTRQVRHAPIAGMAGSLHSWGTYTPAALIASRMELPSRASTGIPSIVRLIATALPIFRLEAAPTRILAFSTTNPHSLAHPEQSRRVERTTSMPGSLFNPSLPPRSYFDKLSTSGPATPFLYHPSRIPHDAHSEPVEGSSGNWKSVYFNGLQPHQMPL